jgi:hypothetical protein
MAIVRIIAPQQADRLKSLGNGICRFGADFSCDVVLIDEGILPVHFCLRVEEDSVAVIMQDGATGELVDRKGQVQLLEPAVEHLWHSGQFLRTAGLDVQMAGLPLPPPTPGRPVGAILRKAAAKALRVAQVGAVSVVALMLMGSGKSGDWLATSSAAVSGVTFPDWSMNEPQVLPDPANPQTEGDIEQFFRTRGFAPDKIRFVDDVVEVVFYLDGTAQQDAVTAVIEETDLKIRPQFFLKSQITGAVSIILERKGSDAKLVSVQDGHVVLSGLRHDEDMRAATRNLIMQDVTGIKSVTFTDLAEDRTDEVRQSISAIWLGQRPYLVLTDGSIIRPGQVLAQDFLLVGVLSSDRISVRIDGLIQEITVK